MRRIDGYVQHYDWGDHSFIPNLLGVAADGRPWAELWLGTHPRGPSTLTDGTPLSDVTGQLPFLLKVLACSQPLSLQTHPNTAQARSGFELGVFADDRSKPELLCALTPFQALCGIRPVDATLALLRELGASHLAAILADDGPMSALTALLRGRLEIESILDACASSARIEAEWVRRLAVRYPGEPSVAATLLMNHVLIAPGDAIRLDAGNLHAYLHGVGIELMAASDNVVRAGLTTKPVDIDLLLEIVDPTPLPRPTLPRSARYDLPDAGVALVRIEAGEDYVATGHTLTIDLRGASNHLAPGDTIRADEITYLAVSANN